MFSADLFRHVGVNFVSDLVWETSICNFIVLLEIVGGDSVFQWDLSPIASSVDSVPCAVLWFCLFTLCCIQLLCSNSLQFFRPSETMGFTSGFIIKFYFWIDLRLVYYMWWYGKCSVCPLKLALIIVFLFQFLLLLC
jgi:hypothetical protein